MTELITSFVDFIEYNVYQNELIYRTIIVVDNNSTDKTVEIANGYQCKVVKNQGFATGNSFCIKNVEHIVDRNVGERKNRQSCN